MPNVTTKGTAQAVSRVSGTLAIDRSTALAPLFQRAATAFQTANPSVQISTTPNGSGTGLKDVAPYMTFSPTSTITVQVLLDFQEAANPSLNYSAIWTLAFVLLVIPFLLVFASRWIASRGA